MKTRLSNLRKFCRSLTILLPVLAGCSTLPQPGDFWTTSDCGSDPKDSAMLPECARNVKRAAPPVQMMDALKRAATLNRDVGSLNRLRKNLQNSSLPDPGEDMTISTLTVPVEEREIPLRIYVPAAAKERPLPVVIYLHGGGWSVGSPADTDDISVGLSQAIPAIVVSVDYRLAPENPYPNGLDDVISAINWTADNIATRHGDPFRLYLAGDSTGGNLAAAAALKNKVEGGPEVRGIMLFYPLLNLYKPSTFSWKRFESGYGLDTILIEQWINCYVPDLRQRNQHYVSPIYADMRYMPPALIFTAQFDAPRDDAKKFAERMKTAGLRVRYVCVPGTTHGYLQNHSLKKVFAGTMTDAAEFVRRTGNHREAMSH